MMKLVPNNWQRWHNPKRAWRMVAVACVFAIPGMLGGGIIAAFLGRPVAWIALGLISSTLFGTWLEGHWRSA